MSSCADRIIDGPLSNTVFFQIRIAFAAALFMGALCSCARKGDFRADLIRHYRGTLSGKGAIRMTVGWKGEDARGTFEILSQKNPIALEGVGNAASWQLTAFSGPGKAIGHFSLKPGGPGILIGTWAPRSGEDEAEVWLHETGNSLPRHAALAGRWENGENAFDFLPLDDGRVKWKGIRIGNGKDGPTDSRLRGVDGIDGVEKDELQYVEEGGDDACRLLIQFQPSQLIVKDNHHCGGEHGSFDGVYRRQSPLTGEWGR